MPLYYTDVPGATMTTNATPNTENDCFFVAPGSARTVWIDKIYPAGHGASLTSISGVQYRMKKWTSTASSGGSAITPTPNDPRFSAATHTAGFSASAVTPGTGGPTLLLSIGSGATSPGNWIAKNLDEAYSLSAALTQSMDIFNVSGLASAVVEISVGTAE